MATTSVLKTLASPTKASFGGTSRSILKRPAALPLFSDLASPRLNSGRVRFASSPTLTSTFATHSSLSYDRSSIRSPNPRASPSTDGFVTQGAPKAFRAIPYQASPLITDFEDPRSPKLQPATKNEAVRFAPFPSSPVTRPRNTPEEAVSPYPRSPYPTSDESATLPNPLIERKRNKKNLTLGRGGTGTFPSISSPLTHAFASPSLDTSLKRTNKPAPLALETSDSDQLNQEFWNSISLADVYSPDDPMVTAIEYPESALMFEAHQDAELRSATAPTMTYAGPDGVPVWSPSLPEPGVTAARLRSSLMSPGFIKSPATFLQRKDVTAPSPNDPFAAFPSFAASLERGGIATSLQYPPRAVQRG